MREGAQTSRTKAELADERTAHSKHVYKERTADCKFVAAMRADITDVSEANSKEVKLLDAELMEQRIAHAKGFSAFQVKLADLQRAHSKYVSEMKSKLTEARDTHLMDIKSVEEELDTERTGQAADITLLQQKVAEDGRSREKDVSACERSCKRCVWSRKLLTRKKSLDCNSQPKEERDATPIQRMSRDFKLSAGKCNTNVKDRRSMEEELAAEQSGLRADIALLQQKIAGDSWSH
ncbi:hypothetical protein BJ742DRAFT_229794 [Cladochytrium replicatum]|nr:hypothetical protein BJ742DRAFT_229794 [Cladochytrium replicatum]